ncbi:MAG: 5-methylcytosine-specific restriction protein A [Rubritalea sp.]
MFISNRYLQPVFKQEFYILQLPNTNSLNSYKYFVVVYIFLAIVRQTMSDNIKRSEEMVQVSFFLSKFGEPSESNSTHPPSEIAANSWKQAYASFYSILGEGRTISSFTNSLKNARDAYDSHLPTGRAGWREAGEDRPPAALPSLHQKVWNECSIMERSALWNIIKNYSDNKVGNIPTSIIDDIDVQIGENNVRTVRTEGKTKVVISTQIERSISLRSDALRIHGYKCSVCSWNFESAYGDWGKGFAEVHHLVSLGEKRGIRETNPETDLAVLCANCHRMVHRKRNVALTLNELRTKLNIAAIKEWASSLA